MWKAIWGFPVPDDPCKKTNGESTIAPSGSSVDVVSTSTLQICDTLLSFCRMLASLRYFCVGAFVVLVNDPTIGSSTFDVPVFSLAGLDEAVDTVAAIYRDAHDRECLEFHTGRSCLSGGKM